MKNGGSPAHRFWISSLTRRVFLWQPVLEQPPGRNTKVPLARNLLSHSGWNAFWRGSLSLFQRKTAKKTLTIEYLPFEIEAPGNGDQEADLLRPKKPGVGDILIASVQ